jgi:hypothetical protein
MPSFIADHTTAFVIAAAVAAVAAVRISINRRLKQSQSWPHVTATILSAAITPPSKGSDYMVWLTYSYFVEEYRGGDSCRLFPNESEANYFVLKIKDAKVDVRYNPKKPGDSILDDAATNPFVEFDKPWL